MICYILFYLFHVYVKILKFTYFIGYFTYLMFMLEYFLMVFLFCISVSIVAYGDRYLAWEEA